MPQCSSASLENVVEFWSCSRHVQNDYSRFFKVYMSTFFHYCLSYFHVLPHCDTYYTSRKGDVKFQHLLDLSKLIFLINRVCM